jgi:hypothetical protein
MREVGGKEWYDELSSNIGNNEDETKLSQLICDAVGGTKPECTLYYCILDGGTLSSLFMAI